MNIGENILIMRKEKGITQEQLADVLCISAGAISKWETASSIPDISMLPKIAKFFGVSIDRLFDFTLTESETPENIIRRVKELSVGFDQDGAISSYNDIQPVYKVDEAISILTEACLKHPNNHELKMNLCHYKILNASKKIKDSNAYKKDMTDVLNELYAITKLNADKDINDRCYNRISEIYLAFKEYNKAAETAKKYGVKNNLMIGYNRTIITALLAQDRQEEAEKHIHNVIYSAVSQIYTTVMLYLSVIKDEEKIKKTCFALINTVKAFSGDSPGPFDFYIHAIYYVLAFASFALREFDECVKYFEEIYNSVERFKIFSETREIKSDFVKLADKEKFVYDMPFDYKKQLLMTFAAFESADTESNDYKNYQELKKREDFQRFIAKIKIKA